MAFIEQWVRGRIAKGFLGGLSLEGRPENELDASRGERPAKMQLRKDGAYSIDGGPWIETGVARLLTHGRELVVGWPERLLIVFDEQGRLLYGRGCVFHLTKTHATPSGPLSVVGTRYLNAVGEGNDVALTFEHAGSRFEVAAGEGQTTPTLRLRVHHAVDNCGAGREITGPQHGFDLEVECLG